MGIGGKIRNRRQELNISRNQLAKAVRVTPSAIANYENGVSYPKLDIMIAMMEALDIDANYLFQDYLADSMLQKMFGEVLSEEEKDTIMKCRKITESGRSLIRVVIEEEYKMIQKQNWVEMPCLQTGRKKEVSGFDIPERQMMIRVQGEHLPPEVDFCFQVKMDGYEPIYKKSDVLAVQKRDAGHNEVGIFLLNGVYYIRILSKQGGSRILHAVNVLESEIVVTKDDQFQCFGTILKTLSGGYELKTI